MGLGMILLITVLALAAIMVASCAYFYWIMQHMVLRRLRELDSIRTDGLPPEAWQKRYLRRTRKRGAIAPEDFARQKKRNLRKLKQLMAFTRKTKLVEDDDVRAGVLMELKTIQQQWHAEEFEDIRF